jgi:hypothetical protein
VLSRPSARPCPLAPGPLRRRGGRGGRLSQGSNSRQSTQQKRDVHTQSIEGFCSLLKSGIGGTYHSVSSKWLHSYLDEYTWRYNHREFTRRQAGVRRVPVGEAKFRLLLGLACRPRA